MFSLDRRDYRPVHRHELLHSVRDRHVHPPDVVDPGEDALEEDQGLDGADEEPDGSSAAAGEEVQREALQETQEDVDLSQDAMEEDEGLEGEEEEEEPRGSAPFGQHERDSLP